MVISILFLLALAVACVWLLVQRSDKQTRAAYVARNVPYIPQKNAFLQVLSKERLEVAKHEIIKREGPVFGFNFLGSYTICVADPELAQLVLSKEFTNFTNRRTFELNDPFIMNALSVVRDEQWKRLRSVITPTFSAAKLKRMKPLIDNTIGTMLKNLSEKFHQNPNSIDMKEIYGAFTMNVTVQCAFGTKVDSLVEKENPVIMHAKKLFSNDMSLGKIISFTTILMAPKLANLLKIRFNGDVTDFFNKFATQIIERKKLEMKVNPNFKAQSFIELLIEAEVEGGVSHEELVAQCILFFLAGYDTTSSAITMASYLLAVHPEIQEKLNREIVDMIEVLTKEASPYGPTDPVELITLESLSRFEYLNAVVSETLRLYAPATFIERKAKRDITLVTEDQRTKLEIKRGDIIQFPIYSMHRNEQHFPDPEAFQPERFLDNPRFHKYSYLPFGSGPRNCVAKSLALFEAKLALLHTLRKYKLSVCPETKIPPEFFFRGQLIVPRDIILKLERR